MELGIWSSGSMQAQAFGYSDNSSSWQSDTFKARPISQKNDIRIGTLLDEVGLVSRLSIETASLMKARNDLPIGSWMVVNGDLTSEQLRTVVQAQSMLKDELVSRDQVTEAMRFHRKQNITFVGALKQARWVRELHLKSNTLGQLLRTAGVVSALNLTRALAIGRSCVLPLGRVLVILGAVSDSVVRIALDLQSEVRAKKITRKECIEKLRMASKRIRTVEEALTRRLYIRHWLGNNPKRLGELLVEAGVLNQRDALTALEMSLCMDKPFGEVLVDFDWISHEFLRAALDVQRLLTYGMVSTTWAMQQLSALHKDGSETVDFSPSCLPSMLPLSREGFYRLTGLSKDGQMVEFNAEVLQAADALHSRVVVGAIELDQAIVALNFCQRLSMTVREALAKIGCTVVVYPYRKTGAIHPNIAA